MKNQRRSFIKRCAGLSALLGFSSSGRSAAAGGQPAGRPGVGKKTFVGPQFFSGAADLPADVFGDLCLMRKGPPQMTYSGVPTTIEPIVSREEWLVKKKALRDIFTMILGYPPPDHACELSLRIEGERDQGDHVERRVSYLLSPGERVASLLLIPKGATTPRPAVLTIHPTTRDGKEQTVGRGEKIDGQLAPAAARRAYGLHLVRRGYVTFSPDLLGAGERIYPGRREFDNQPFIDAHPTWSGTGKDLWDLRRALDVMQAMPEIDPQRLASLGHSQGAGLTCYLAAVDERVRVGVSNCGVWPARIHRNPFHQARTQWWTGQPANRPFCAAGKPFPIDDHELLALAAPRAILNISALNDSGFKPEDESFTRPAWENLGANVKKIYALFGAADRFQLRLHLDGHDFHDPVRELAYAFLDSHLQ
jgi:dienelactone hydrolase